MDFEVNAKVFLLSNRSFSTENYLTSISGVVQSHHFPGMAPPDSVCSWRIIGPENWDKWKIFMHSIDLPEEDCIREGDERVVWTLYNGWEPVDDKKRIQYCELIEWQLIWPDYEWQSYDNKWMFTYELGPSQVQKDYCVGIIFM